jgi:serine/threonine protein kinase/tetratricopeptide (TPR) repeat protein
VEQVATVPFGGTARFEVLTCLGTGGMGVVYAARDREKDARVALKTLRRMTPEALLRFKNEFRSLQDLQHPNLVTLGELIEESGQWFFTMELIEGVDFLSYTCRGEKRPRPAAFEPTGSLEEDVETLSAVSTSASRASWQYDEPRLRLALSQLASGLGALHAAGHVHRDVKPSNILITQRDRLVLIDFGLVGHLEHGTTRPESRAIGTTAYMAPEQAAAAPVGPLADCYSVGVLLYQAITGRLPFEAATPTDIVRRKGTQDPLPPRAHEPMIPRDLDALCVALLRRHSDERAGLAEVLEWLGETARPSAAHLSHPSSVVQGASFVGREPELALLRQAYDDSRTENVVTVLVYGESGIGKTALVRRFVHELDMRYRDAVVLSGRCYERESVPYKAVDGIIDALSRYLLRLPRLEVMRLLPIRAAYLAHVFPALRQVEAMAEAPQPVSLVDPQELRSRVVAALRDLLTRLALSCPLVVTIDDFQWADADSLALLREVLRKPEAPPLLLLCTLRGAPTDFPALLASVEGALELRRLALEALPASDAQELARQCLLHGRSRAIADPTLIAREAAGHPLFIAELAYHAQAVRNPDGPSPHLDEALSARSACLELPLRQLLELCAVAGGPLPQAVLATAAESDQSTFDQHLAVLRVGHWVRTAGARRGDTVEPYHDRIREAVLATLLPETRRACHERLATALEAHGTGGPEMLAMHYRHAGHLDRAVTLYAVAADQAATALAFEHAARLYQLSCELRPKDDPETRGLLAKLGEAMANSGRCAEAARTLQAAAQGADPDAYIDLTRRAAQYYLTSGHVDEGMSAVDEVLRAVGLRWPSSFAATLFSIAWTRGLLALRGMRYEIRDESQVPKAELRRVDVLFSLVLGMGWVDLGRSFALQSQHNLLAIRTGERFRVIRALCCEASLSACQGRGDRCETLLGEAMALTLADHNPQAMILTVYTRAVVYQQQGRWRQAYDLCRDAYATWREHSAGLRHLVLHIHVLETSLLYYQGRLKELGRAAEEYRNEGEIFGDRLHQTVFRTCESNLAWLAQDDPHEARRQATLATRIWFEHGALVQVYADLVAQGNIDLYEQQDSQSAWERTTMRWPALRRTLLLGVPLIRVNMVWLRARAALAAAAGAKAHARERYLTAATRDAKRLEHAPMPYCHALAKLLGAGIAALRGDSETGARLAGEASGEFEATDMALLAAAARRQHGRLAGGTEGQALIARADLWMTSEGVVNPSRMAAMLAPMAQAS